MLEHSHKRQRVSAPGPRRCPADDADAADGDVDVLTVAAEAMASRAPLSPQEGLGVELRRLLDGRDSSGTAGDDDDDDAAPLLRRAWRFHRLLVTRDADDTTGSRQSPPPPPLRSLPHATDAVEAPPNHGLADLDAALAVRVQAHLVLLLSRALAEPAAGRGTTASGTGPASRPNPSTLRRLLECLEALCLGTDDGTTTSAPSAAERHEVAGLVVRVLDAYGWWHGARQDESNYVRDDDLDSATETEEDDGAAWAAAAAAALRLLDRLAPGLEALSGAALLTVVDAATACSRLECLKLSELLHRLGDGIEGASRRRARAVRAVLDGAADADGVVADCRAHHSDDLFQLQCLLRVRREPLSDADVAILVQRLPKIVLRKEKADSEQALQAVDCLVAICDKSCLPADSLNASAATAIVKAFRELLVDACTVGVKRALSGGLEWCWRRQLVPELLGQADQTDCRQSVIASLLEILFDQDYNSTTTDPLVLRKMQLQEVRVIKLLTSIMDFVLRDDKDSSTTVSISEADILSICTVLMDHTNEAVAIMSTKFLCQRLQCTPPDEPEAHLSYIISLSHAALQHLREKRHPDVVASIVCVWSALAMETNSVVAAALARDPAVLTVLVEVASDGARSHAAQAQAVRLLTRLGRDVCNRRLLSCHNGLLPCLIRCVREDASGAGETTSSVDRETLKTCIMDLAMAL